MNIKAGSFTDTANGVNGTFYIGYNKGGGTLDITGGTFNSNGTVFDSKSSIEITGIFYLNKNSVLNLEVDAIGTLGGISTNSVDLNAAGAAFIVDLSVVTTFVGTLDIALLTSDTAFTGLFADMTNLSLSYIGENGLYIDLVDNTPEFFMKNINGKYVLGLSITAVPEPSTYALILGSLTFLTLAIRRRKKGSTL